MEKCWQENPDFRPNFENIRKDLLALIEKEVIIEICFKNANLTLFFWFLRTVPTIVIAHTFCASPDTRISYR